MKINLSLLICCMVVAAFAQEITLTQEAVDPGTVKKRYKYHSFDQYDQKFLIKLGTHAGVLNNFTDGFSDLPFDLVAMEYLFTKRMSIEGTYHFPLNEVKAISFRLRRYLKKDRLANNMSGNYFALEYSKAK